MKKLILSILAMLLLTFSFVQAETTDLSIESIVVNPSSGEPGDSLSITISVKNNGLDTISSV
ncbi:MAG: hypothetical protein AABY07_09570, partial [Nanoarchaeota archaeon]